MSFQKKIFSLIIIFVIATVGVYLYNTNFSSPKPNRTIQPTSMITPQPTSSQSPTSTDTATTETAIRTKVLQFYKEYSESYDLDALNKKGYLTQEGYATLKKSYPYDPVFCTQGGSQAPLEIDSVTLTGKEATVTLKQYFEGSKTYNYITVTLNSAEKKITSIVCKLN